MKRYGGIPFVTFIIGLALVIPLTARTDGRVTSSVPLDVTVNFGDPTVLAGAANQVVVPEEATIRQGGTVTFVVNGGFHGIAIYPVSKNTTREDITAQLCPHDVNNICTDSAFANADHAIRDGRDHIVIETGTNAQFARIDDPTNRLFSTSGQLGSVAGAFLTGTTASALGNVLQYRFTKAGRYLVICMNRSHTLSNWMFGFVTVVGDNEDVQ
jgi:plastocyanin